MQFSAARSGTIVGLLPVGALLGCLFSAPMQDKWGRKYMVCGCALLYILGVIIEITSERQWVQIAMGRLVTGLGVGALSTAVPTYQQECVPKNIRNPIVASYQLFITLGILLAYLVNFGTSKSYDNSAQWRITVGISAVWALILGGGILFMPESPRWVYRNRELDGNHTQSAAIIASLAGLPPNSLYVQAELAEIESKAQEETRALAENPAKWSDIFTAPGMLHRVLLGCILQAGQQLTGANYFFYYGTTIFKSSGISNSFITSVILGVVNFGATCAGLWVVKRFGARRALMCGAAWMMVCFFVFAFVGHEKLIVNPGPSTKTAGTIMIVFTCLFIAAFATTWGPMGTFSIPYTLN
jgi:SP family sugar:H+ symporter-like MFS transporter